MPLTLEEIKELHDAAYEANQTTRERAVDDLVFHWVTQWDDTILDETQLAFRGEFDILRRATRSILTDLDNNPVQVDFEPEDENDKSAAELLDGLYRAETRHNLSIEAFNNADTETVVCGMGAWMLYTDYESLDGDDNKQVIRRRPIYEAASRVYFDPNDRSLDKSEAEYVCVLTPYSERAFKQLYKELKGKELDEGEISNFKTPERTYTFPWVHGESKKIWVGEFFHREVVKDTLYIFTDPLGAEMKVLASDFEGDPVEELTKSGHEFVNKKETRRYKVTKYIVTGKEILSQEEIPGQHLPVIVEYGEHAVVEGEEHFEGCVRLAKDPQRLRNFQMSYLADIASRSPREKPIFYPEQVAGYENMYSTSGAENNYPYALINRVAPDGTPLPPSPIATLPAPQIPPALAASIDLTRQAVEDVANPGVPEKFPDRDVSGHAIALLQARIDMQSAVYQKHRKHARRRDGEVFASMASVVYDVPRTVEIEKPDGTRQRVNTMTMVFNPKTNEFEVVRDISNKNFKVFTQISTSYATQKEQLIAELQRLMEPLPPQDPMRNILLLKILRLRDGIDFEDVREYANKQLLLLGVRKPENEEELQFLQQAQQNQQPNPEMLLAQAELLKGQAMNKEAEIKAMQAQADAATKNAKVQVDAFNAQTKRFEAQIDAQEAGAKINKDAAETFGTQIENQAKLIQLKDPKNMSDTQLMELVFGR